MGNSLCGGRNDVSYKPPCLQCKLSCVNNNKDQSFEVYSHVARKFVLSFALGLGDPKSKATMQYFLESVNHCFATLDRKETYSYKGDKNL